MTEPPHREDDPQEIVRWSWARLRRSKMHNQMNPEAESWETIEIRNNLGKGIEKAMQAWRAAT